MAENNGSGTAAPLDAAAAAKVAFAEVTGEPFPTDIYTAPQLSWTVIGCGVIANQMATSLALSGRHLRGVANRTREKAEASPRYGVERVYDSAEELYQDPGVDAAHITTPHNTHYPLPARCPRGRQARSLREVHHAQLRGARRGFVRLREKQRGAYGCHDHPAHAAFYQEFLRRANAGEFGAMNLAQLNLAATRSTATSPTVSTTPGWRAARCSTLASTRARSLMRPSWQASPRRSFLSPTWRRRAGPDLGNRRNKEGQMGVLSLTLHSSQPKRS